MLRPARDSDSDRLYYSYRGREATKAPMTLRLWTLDPNDIIRRSSHAYNAQLNETRAERLILHLELSLES